MESKSMGQEEDDVELSDFRDTSTYPQTEELFAKENVGIRKNKIKGCYKNVEQYLNIHFRLLREDFIAPLRKGLKEYLSRNDGHHKNQIPDIIVHTNVSFLRKQTVRSEVGFLVQVSANAQGRNVVMMKRLMLGSLIGFTEDGFKTIQFGKIIDQDNRYLVRGQVVIQFYDHVRLEWGKNYTMVQCLVFFEPYFHVLNALKQIDVLNFPLRQYLIEVNYSPELPRYIKVNGLLKHTVNEITHNLPVKSPNLWPGYKLLGLNPAQYEALKAALSQTFSIIQGPPGTGKTFIGLKIAKILLENKSKWNRMGPMLVVCYTNHALDQFLEGLLSATKDLVRIGSRSKNPLVRKCILANHRTSYKKENVLILRAHRNLFGSQMTYLGESANILKKIMRYDSIMDLFDGDGLEKVDELFEGSWFDKATNSEILVDWLLEGASGWNVDGGEKVIKEDGKKTTNSKCADTKNKLYYTYLDNEDDRYKKASTIISLYKLNLLIINNKRKQEEIIVKFNEEHDKILQDGKHLRRYYAYMEHNLNKLKADFGNCSKPQSVDYVNPLTMPHEDRWKLYNYWLNLYINHLHNSMTAADEKYRRQYKEYEEVRDRIDAAYMRTKNVIGMTTTAAARLHETLQTLKCPIVIVEEAAVVLEAHVIAALSKHCNQLILIGDHKQLRPSTADYHIAKDYNLGISLFERMIMNGYDCNTLNVQHRMRPEIAKLVSPSIYPTLRNHESVLKFLSVKGVEKSLYFITHNNREVQALESSKKNSFEARYLMRLANYLVLNGYEANQITILSAYSGQTFEMMREQKAYESLEEVKISTLDGYQGEENDIILLSLVRNNDKGVIGFLKLENRVCVALSRAKLGLYIMGNIDQLCNSEIWKKVRDSLEEEKSLGTSLPLQCQNHPNIITLIKRIEDFDSVPEGGCMFPCSQMKECGHICTKRCHVLPHSRFRCNGPCLKVLCKYEHVCPRLCHQACGNCEIPKTRQLPCGHVHNIPCHMTPAKYKCPTLLQIKLQCSHLAEKLCHLKNVQVVVCTSPCGATISGCRHICLKTCHIMDDPNHQDKYKCMLPCNRPNDKCSQPDNPDHKCKKTCSDRCSSCTFRVAKKRQCGHLSTVKCSEDANQGICLETCNLPLPCGHLCKQNCRDKCGDCQEWVSKIIEECGHIIDIHCSTEPTKLDCTEKCSKMLLCGHKCMLKCSEDCSRSICKELVNILNEKSACGHKLVVPCYLKDNHNREEGLKHCTEPCGMRLGCIHRCKGRCGQCYQGRLHIPCMVKLNTSLICGHNYNALCYFSYKLCSEPCGYKCEHGTCKEECGDPCTDCKEKCARVCEHAACTNLCFEKCNINPCTEPCKKALECGHGCIGYCGDKCPPLCRICDKDVVMEVDTDEAARFVYLEECGHVVEGFAVDNVFKKATPINMYKTNFISYLYCPKCGKAIRQTRRYRDSIKAFLKDMQMVKINCFRKITCQEDVIGKCRELSLKFPCVKQLLLNWIKDVSESPDIYNVVICNGKLIILNEILDICTSTLKYDIVRTHAEFLLQHLRNIYKMGNQTIADFRLEMRKLERMIQYSQIKEANADCVYLEEYKMCEKIVLSIGRYSNDKDQILKDGLMVLNKKIKSGLVITDSKSRKVELPISMLCGNWYKCCSGHINASPICLECFDASMSAMKLRRV